MPVYSCCGKRQRDSVFCRTCGKPLGPDASLAGLRDHLNKAIDDLSVIPTPDGKPLLEPDEKTAKKLKLKTVERDQRSAWVAQLDEVLAELEAEATEDGPPDSYPQIAKHGGKTHA